MSDSMSKKFIDNGSSNITEVELVYHNKTKPNDRPAVGCSSQAYDLLLKSWDMNKIDLQEQFRIMLLDRKNACIGISTVALGGISSCLVDLKIAFATALKATASKIILAHNHPSGNKSPSEEDKRLTTKFAAAGKLLELPVVDHIIVTRDSYTSFADEGILDI